jgi:MoaA/NifB/PqqE/SkfB family radical SAM enzyme
MRAVRGLRRLLPIPGLVGRALAGTEHPILAQIVPMRRCNLTCAYCNEYDRTSAPVALDTVHGWLDRLADLGTEIVTLSGGEPMLHPEVDDIVAGIRSRGMIAGLITNGYLLQPVRIERLNRAGLQFLQVSIDNLRPDAVSKKSLELVDAKLVNLARLARFQVNVNTVLGAGCERPEDALVIARRAGELGFSTSVGIIHDGTGQLRPLNAREAAVYAQIAGLARGMYGRIRGFQDRLIAGQPNDWQCRAGARYLYVCEEGKVHYCSQQRGYPGIPLADYTAADIRREFDTVKDCAPLCTIGCVHRVSVLDRWRGRQQRPDPRRSAQVEREAGGAGGAAASSSASDSRKVG